MAFIASNLFRQSLPGPTQLNVVTNEPQVHLPVQYGYASQTDTIATVSASGYFVPFANHYQPIDKNVLAVGDLIYCICLDGNVQLTVATVGATITTAVAAINAGAVVTASIANGAVTLAKLAAGITPSHVIKFASQYTTVGGAAAEAIAVAGAVAATDRAFVQVVDNGTANVTVLQAAVTTNTLTVTFSGNPGADCIINYQIIRAAA